MAEMADVVGSPIPKTLGGREWLFSPLSLATIGGLQRWRVQQAGEALLERDADAKYKLLQKDERWKVIQEMMHPTPPEDGQMIPGGFDPESISYILWQSVLPNHPGTKYKVFAALISTEDVAELDSLAAAVFPGGPMEELADPDEGAATSEDPPSQGGRAS